MNVVVAAAVHAAGASRPTSAGPGTECAFRKFSYAQALRVAPDRAPLLSVFDALELETM